MWVEHTLCDLLAMDLIMRKMKTHPKEMLIYLFRNIAEHRVNHSARLLATTLYIKMVEVTHPPKCLVILGLGFLILDDTALEVSK